MFQQINNNALDIFPIQIQTLNAPLPNSFVLETEDREFYQKTLIENTMASYISNKIINLIKWDKVYVAPFPDKLFGLPALLYKNNEDEGIILNQNLATAKYNVDDKKWVISEINDFISCLAYGLIKHLLINFSDEQDIRNIAFIEAVFLYSLIIKTHIRDYDFMNVKDIELATIFFGCSQLTIEGYMSYSGNRSLMSLGFLNTFFFKSSKLQIRINPKDIPPIDSIDSYASLFEYLNKYTLLKDITVESFRNKIIELASFTGIVGVSSGIDLATMLTISRISSQVINSRFGNINPVAASSILKILETKIKKEEDYQEEEHVLDKYNTTKDIKFK